MPRAKALLRAGGAHRGRGAIETPTPQYYSVRCEKIWSRYLTANGEAAADIRTGILPAVHAAAVDSYALKNSSLSLRMIEDGSPGTVEVGPPSTTTVTPKSRPIHTSGKIRLRRQYSRRMHMNVDATMLCAIATRIMRRGSACRHHHSIACVLPVAPNPHASYVMSGVTVCRTV